MSRWILFFIMVAMGIGGGLYYGWRIDPVEYTDTSPATLRDDYKADYVLMVAEAYQVEGNLDFAAARLSLLGSLPPGQIVTSALQYAATIKPPYAEADLAIMRSLADDLKSNETAAKAGANE